MTIDDVPVGKDDDFPFGIESGSSTRFQLTCDFCGTIHNYRVLEGSDESQGADNWVRYFDFGSFTIGPCCFRRLEQAVYPWAPAIVDWLGKKARRHELAARSLSAMSAEGATALKVLKDKK